MLMAMLKENNFDVSKTRKIPVPRAAEAYGRRLKISCVFLNYSNFTGFTNPLLHQGQTSRSFPTTPVVFQPNPPSTPLTGKESNSKCGVLNRQRTKLNLCIHFTKSLKFSLVVSTLLNSPLSIWQ